MFGGKGAPPTPASSSRYTQAGIHKEKIYCSLLSFIQPKGCHLCGNVADIEFISLWINRPVVLSSREVDAVYKNRIPGSASFRSRLFPWITDMGATVLKAMVNYCVYICLEKSNNGYEKISDSCICNRSVIILYSQNQNTIAAVRRQLKLVPTNNLFIVQNWVTIICLHHISFKIVASLWDYTLLPTCIHMLGIFLDFSFFLNFFQLLHHCIVLDFLESLPFHFREEWENKKQRIKWKQARRQCSLYQVNANNVSITCSSFIVYQGRRSSSKWIIIDTKTTCAETFLPPNLRFLHGGHHRLHSEARIVFLNVTSQNKKIKKLTCVHC